MCIILIAGNIIINYIEICFSYLKNSEKYWTVYVLHKTSLKESKETLHSKSFFSYKFSSMFRQLQLLEHSKISPQATKEPPGAVK